MLKIVKDVSRIELLNSACIAVLICANPLCWLFSFIPGILALILLIDECVFVLANKKFPSHWCLFIIIGILIFGLNFLLSPISDVLINYFSYFLICGFVGYHMGTCSFSTKYVIIFCAVIGVLFIPYLNNINFEYDEIWASDAIEGSVRGYYMGISYGILRLYLGILFTLLLYTRKRLWRFVLLFSIVFYSMLYLEIISRGCIVAIMFSLFMYVDIKAGKRRKYKVFIYILVLILLLLILNFESVVSGLANILLGQGLDAFFLVKNLDGADILNGRGEIFSRAFSDISDNILFGCGIGGFEAKYKAGYIHNYLIQAYYEMGILPFLYILFITIMGIRIVFNKRIDPEKRLFLSFIISAGLIELLFSSIYWRSQIFWFFVGYTTNLLIKREYTKIQYNTNTINTY